MSWKKAFLISLSISIVVFILGYLLSTAFFVVILFVATVITIAVSYKFYNDWNKEFVKYFYTGLREDQALEGIILARSTEHAEKLARTKNIIIVNIREANESELHKYT